MHTSPGSKVKVARGVAWQGAARWGTQLLSFGFYAGLARLLSPRIFGLVAIAWVYLALVQVLVRQGLGDAIVQRHDLEPEHLDSAFWIAMATASFLCLLSFLFAGPVAAIFKEARVAPVIRWLSLYLPIGALYAVPMALLTRELNFRPLAIGPFIGAGVGGAVGLTMAFLGFGVWSLVVQQLTNGFLSCVYLWLVVPWRPHLRISKRHLRDLYGFSLNLTANGILWFFAQKSDQAMVGYGFGSLGLGPYSLASRVSTMLHDGLIQPFQAVAFPAFSRLHLEPQRLERALHDFCEMTSFISLPVFGGLAVVAPELVPVLFGPKWASAIPIVQILAVLMAIRGVLGFVHPTMLAKGRTGLYLVISIVLAALTFLGCLIAVRWSPAAIALSMILVLSIVGVFEFLLVTIKVTGIRPLPLLKKFLFPTMSTMFMVAVVVLVRGLVANMLSSLSTLVVCIAVGGGVYTLTALLLRPDLVKTIWEMVNAAFLHRVFPECVADSQSPVEFATSVAERPAEP